MSENSEKIRKTLNRIQKNMRTVKYAKEYFFDKRIWGLDPTKDDQNLFLGAFDELRESKDKFNLLKDIYEKRGLSDLANKSKTAAKKTQNIIDEHLISKRDPRYDEIDKIVEILIDHAVMEFNKE